MSTKATVSSCRYCACSAEKIISDGEAVMKPYHSDYLTGSYEGSVIDLMQASDRALTEWCEGLCPSCLAVYDKSIGYDPDADEDEDTKICDNCMKPRTTPCE
jgi:hypothetical protein